MYGTKQKIIDKLLSLARWKVSERDRRQTDKYGEYVEVFCDYGDSGSWSGLCMSIRLRPQKNGTFSLEAWSHFRHSSADIPIWENDEWGELPKPWWEDTKIASVSVRSLNKPLFDELENIGREILGKVGWQFVSYIKKVYHL